MDLNSIFQKLNSQFGDDAVQLALAPVPPAPPAPAATPGAAAPVAPPPPAPPATALSISENKFQEVAAFLKKDGALDFDTLSCLSGVDLKDRIELVYHLTSYKKKHELTLKVTLPRENPGISSVEQVWNTANWYERECFDLLGVKFRNHSDLRRILLPEDWVGHPLRKDYVAPTEYHGISHTRPDPLNPKERSLPVGEKSELKDLSELIALSAPVAGEMVLNMGPQHPSTHGVLNFLIVTDGEVMHRATPHIGYLHRGIEKLAEKMEFNGFMPFTDRIDYLAAMSANHGYALSVEKLLGCTVPPRAEYLRVIASELNRIASHLVATGTMAMDIGAFTPFIHWLREREYINDFIEAICGSRLTYNYMRIGGVAYDMPRELPEKILRWLDHFESIIDEFDRLISNNEIFVQRLAHVGVISSEDALSFGLVGPNLRASGVKWDLRKDMPYSVYPKLQFDVPVGKGFRGSVGDSYDRFVVRILEMRESAKILRQALRDIPEGEIRISMPRVRPPAGDTYARVEAPRGEMGYYLVSDGQASAYRLKVKTGSFTAMSIVEKMSKGILIADLVAIIGSLDVIAPEVDR